MKAKKCLSVETHFLFLNVIKYWVNKKGEKMSRPSKIDVVILATVWSVACEIKMFGWWR